MWHPGTYWVRRVQVCPGLTEDPVSLSMLDVSPTPVDVGYQLTKHNSVSSSCHLLPSVVLNTPCDSACYICTLVWVGGFESYEETEAQIASSVW